MIRTFAQAAALVFALASLTPKGVQAQEVARVVVVPLDEAAESRSLDTEAVRVLEPTELNTLHGAELDQLIEEHRIDAPPNKALSTLQASTQNIARGVESFFYMTPDRAIPELEPVLEAAWHAPEVLAFRPDLADQVWQAGIVLIRAALEVSGKEVASRYALELITMMPSRQTDPKIVPPDAREVLENARLELANANTKVRLDGPSANCSLFINGAPASSQSTYFVDPSSKYFVHADCGLPSAPSVWRLSVQRGGSVLALVPALSPQRFRMTGESAEERREAEWYLRATASFVRAEIAVGVGSPRGADDSVVLARFNRREQTVTWSDADYTDSIRRGMPVIFPEYADLFVPDEAITAKKRSGQEVDWIGVTAVSAGAAASGVGVFMLLTAGKQGHLLDCAVNNPSPPAGEDCSDVPEDTFFDDFSGETQKVGSVRTGGWVLVGVGAAAVGYGLYRLLRPAPRAAKSAPEGLAFTGTGMVFTW